MTPEERIKDAIAWVIRHPETEPLSELAYSILVERGAEAIQEAVAAERAACAQHLLTEYPNDSWAAEAAAAIRARGETPTETTSHADLRRWGRCRRCGAEVSETHAIAGRHHAGCAIGVAWTMLHRALEGEA